MVQRLSIRLFLLGILTCLLVAAIGLPVNKVIGDQQDETITPGLTEETPTEEAVIETPTSQIENIVTTDEPTVVPSATSTFTAIPAPLLAGNYVADEILVRFKKSATEETIAECLRQINGEVKSTIEEISVTVIQIEAIKVSNAVALLSACPAVRYVEPNYLAYMADTIPTDSSWGLQYGLVNIRAPQGWDTATGSSSVTIAILDTGVDLAHSDLSPKIVPGYDFVNNDSIAQDDNGHGTHVAGIAAAVTNNGSGVAGVSWGALIMPIKVLNAGGGGSFADVASGIIWAVDNGAQIINLSLGGASPSSVLQDAVNYAYGNGVVLVAAAGNTGSNFVLYPAQYPNVIAVAATDSSNLRAGFSNYGPEVDLSAPGVSIYSTSPGSTYIYRSGTSMSAPYVSGLAAILRGIPGIGGPDQIAFEMESTALDLGAAGWDDFYGAGLIQMDAAIQLAFPPTAPPGSQQGNSPSNQPGILFINTATLTPSLTPTLGLMLLPSQTATLTPPAPVPSETGEVNALGGASATRFVQPEPFMVESNWPLGCLGVILVMLGVFLFFASKRRNEKGHLKLSLQSNHWQRRGP